MPIIGGRQISVRGLGFQGAGKPNPPTINSVTRVSDTQVTLSWTAGANNGAPITSISIISSPSISLTYTTTDLDGSVNVTGSFVSNQAYTFTMTTINAVGSSDSSAASSSVIPAPLAVVTGGTLTSDATYYYRTFTSNGTLEVLNFPTADLIHKLIYC